MQHFLFQQIRDNALSNCEIRYEKIDHLPLQENLLQLPPVDMQLL
jgi:hypothetical protein